MYKYNVNNGRRSPKSKNQKNRMTAPMKHKRIIFFSSLFSMVLLLSLLPFWNLQYLKVFTSTAQAHSPSDLSSSTEEEKPKESMPTVVEAAEDPINELNHQPEESKVSQSNPPSATQDTILPPAKDQNTETVSQPVEENSGAQENEQVSPEVKKVYLTFDDGPSPVTGLLLDTLEKYHAHATFFMLENRMKLYPDSVTRLAEDGHGLGLHGVTHDKKKFYQSPESAVAEMKLAQSTLSNLTGITTELIRTPYGSKPYLTDEQKKAISEAGFIIWDWNVDSKDWYFRDERLVEYTINQIEKLTTKGIEPVILLHDNKYTVDCLPQLLSYLLDQQYEFGILDGNMEPVAFQ